MHYDETFSSVVRFELLRSLFAIAVQTQLKIHQLNITVPFLNGHMEQEMFMNQPERCVEEKGTPGIQNLYGLKQSPRCWNSTLDDHLKSMGYLQSVNDPCIYIRRVVHYVDNYIIAGESTQRIKHVKMKLAQKFDIKDRGEFTTSNLSKTQRRNCLARSTNIYKINTQKVWNR